ncbi:lumican-like [Arctopsyche grandis]|uniref:lumican-like n=1 Tax=Arctopsyche grandis TaxID=121162 RepID=UPI00406D8378
MAFIGYFAANERLTRIKQISGVMILFCIAIIFPVTQSYAVQKNEQKSSFAPRCFTDIESGIFHIRCDDVNVNDLTVMIEEEIKNFPIERPTIDTLTIRNLSIENGKLSQNWINTTSFRISRLQIYTANTNSIENKAFVGYAFEKLRDLRLDNMKIDTIEEGTFEGLQSLQLLDVSRLEVNHINENALKLVAPTLEILFVNSMVLPFNPTNLTGTVELPQIHAIVMSGNKMSFIDSGSFAQISNIKFLYLDYSEIENIGCGTFQKMILMKRLRLDRNSLTTLDPCVFGDEIIGNLQTSALNLANNKWNCNCDLDWLKQLKISNKVFDEPRCASHSDLPFEDVNFCEAA